MAKKPKKTEETVFRKNFNAFVEKMGFANEAALPAVVSISETEEDLVVTWGKDHATAFRKDGTWTMYNRAMNTEADGHYPSGSGHYSETIKRVLGV